MPTISTAEAIKQGLTAQHIATNLANYEAARSPFFVLQISGLDNLIKSKIKVGIDELDRTVENNFYNSDLAEEVLRLNVTKCPIPHYELATMEYKRGNDVVKFAGTPTYSSGSITVDDLVGVKTKALLMAWLRLAFDPHTLKGGRMSEYKKECTLMEYTQDYELIRTWTIHGCWISKIDEGEFDRENDQKRQLTVTFQYDRAEMEDEEDASFDSINSSI